MCPIGAPQSFGQAIQDRNRENWSCTSGDKILPLSFKIFSYKRYLVKNFLNFDVFEFCQHAIEANWFSAVWNLFAWKGPEIWNTITGLWCWWFWRNSFKNFHRLKCEVFFKIFGLTSEGHGYWSAETTWIFNLSAMT